VLALDLGSRLGFAYDRPDGALVTGTALFAPIKGEHPAARYVRFIKWLRQVLDISRPDAVAWERIVRSQGFSGAAVAVYHGFETLLLMECYARRLRELPVAVGTWKKVVVGHGRADKEAVIRAMRELGHLPADDNEADALAIREWALHTHGQRPASVEAAKPPVGSSAPPGPGAGTPTPTTGP